jgi:murein DD-endopeptidase MepM/ murein hydrolase activator NlpD
MKRLLACVLIVFIATACNATIPTTPPGTGVNRPTTEANSSPTVYRQTSTIAAPFPTDLPTSTATPTPVPCDPSEKYCIESGHFFLDRPIALPGTDTIDRGYPYGDTEGGKRDPHHGVEFYNASGTPVLAAADGLVVLAGNDSQTMVGPRFNFYGNIVVLEHHFPGIPQPVYTVYGHLSKVEVQTGQTVRSGDKIGEVGTSGEAIGSHLHFEVRSGQNNYDSNRNPVLWLKPLTGEDGAAYGAIAGRLVDARGKTLYTTDLNIQYFLDTTQPQTTAYQVETYAPEKQSVHGDDLWNENFTLSDIPAGNYRLSLVWGGKLVDRWVVVLPGKLTFVVFQIDQ